MLGLGGHGDRPFQLKTFLAIFVAALNYPLSSIWRCPAMAKGNSGGEDRAKVKLRVIEFELEGAN
jgi:hypothetical protein